MPYNSILPHLWLVAIFTLIIPIHCIATTTAPSSDPKTNEQANQLKSQPETFKSIKALIQKKNLDQAKTLAIDHLKSNPNDVDVILLLGIIYYQQAAYEQAEKNFRQVLQKTPTYLDAKIGLVRVMIVKKKYKEASDLISELKKAAPHNPEVKQLQESYQKATSIPTPSLAPKNVSAKPKAAIEPKEQPNYIDVLLTKNVNHALRIINADLNEDPTNKRLLTQKANAYFKLHLYSQSAYYVKKALEIDPSYAPAKDRLSSINEISPNKAIGLNEIGLSTLNEYVSDLHQIWDYSTLHFTRETWRGSLSARLNYAHRQGKGACQGEFEYFPIINPYLSLDIYYSFANQPALFPKNAFAVEGYGTIPDLFTLSLGEYYAHILGPIGYRKITGSVNKDIGSNSLTFRVNHYEPNSGESSTLYIGTIRHSFNTLDCYLSFTAGYGKSPDLADLLTSNFIIIRNKFISANLRFPIFCHRILVDIGVDHQEWRYPSDLNRRLTGGTIGLSYRF